MAPDAGAGRDRRLSVVRALALSAGARLWSPDAALQLPDAAGAVDGRVDRRGRARRRAGLPRVLQRRRDLPQGHVAALRRRGAADRAHPVRTVRVADLPPGSHLRGAARGDARRAQRRTRRGRVRHREPRDARAVRHHLEGHAADRPPARGPRRDAGLPRPRRDRLRGRLLPLLGRVHGRASGAGAAAAQDRRDGRPEVHAACGGDRRRDAHRLRLLGRGDQLRARAGADRRRACRPGRGRPRRRRQPAGRDLDQRRGRPGCRARAGRVLHPLDARHAARAPWPGPWTSSRR